MNRAVWGLLACAATVAVGFGLILPALGIIVFGLLVGAWLLFMDFDVEREE